MVEVPRKLYGYFFSGDSYIVMNEKDAADGKIAYDLHIWIGGRLIAEVMRPARSNAATVHICHKHCNL